MPVLAVDLGPGETRPAPTFDGYRGPVALLLGSEGGIDAGDVGVVTIAVPVLDPTLRTECWTSGADGFAIEDVQRLARGFLLQGQHLRRIARNAVTHAQLAGREALSFEDARVAARELSHEQLDTLAVRLEEPGGWRDLVVPFATADALRELERRCLAREQLAGRLGPAFGGGFGTGVRALMTGSSGTGKTLAARILAAEVDKDLYRVDLASITDKYVGETEKKLHQLLSRAEALDVVLLLDEGDSLLGKRTADVRSANDRYANLETNYLLQQLESYSGIVLVTTNLGDAIDTAFMRRMDVVVPFFPPGPPERLRILFAHLPADHLIEVEFLERVAARCALTGGQLRNVAVRASLNALTDGSGSVQTRHFEDALRAEFAKTGGTFPFDGEVMAEPNGDSMDAFVAALGGGSVGGGESGGG